MLGSELFVWPCCRGEVLPLFLSDLQEMTRASVDITQGWSKK